MAGNSQASPKPTGIMWKVGLGALLAGIGVVIVLSFLPKAKANLGDVVLICTNPACNAQWSSSLADIGKVKHTTPVDDNDYPRYECPKCGQLSSVAATKCPSCQEYFLLMQAKDAPSGGKTCPKCGVDILQYGIEHAK
jgi:hypothetical protein